MFHQNLLMRASFSTSIGRPSIGQLIPRTTVNRPFSVYLDVVNVLMNPDRQSEFGYGRPQTPHVMRPQFFFSVNARM